MFIEAKRPADHLRPHVTLHNLSSDEPSKMPKRDSVCVGGHTAGKYEAP